MSWYNKPGETNTDQNFFNNPNPKSVWSFYLKAGEKKRVIFLDDAQFKIWEAKLKIGQRYERFTANTADPNDPLTEAAAMKRVYLTMTEYYTVLDLTPYEDKQGKTVPYAKRSLAVPKTMQEAIARRRQEAGGSLVGCEFIVHRDSDKSPACGNDWSFQKKHDLKAMVTSGKIKADMIEPNDFAELLKPLNPAVVRAALQSMSGREDSNPGTVSRSEISNPFSSDEPSTVTQSASTTDDIPF